MMRSVILYSVLLVGSLVATYVTMTADEVVERKPGETEVYRAREGEVEQITYKTDSMEIRLEKTRDERGDYLLVHVSDEVEEPAPPVPTDAPAATDPPPEPVKRTRKRTFTGNLNALRLFKSYEPLVALREVPASALTDNLGFDEPLGELIVQRSAGPVTVVLGGKSYGLKHVYGQVDDRVFLLRESSLKPLMGDPRRLMGRTLHPLQANDIVSATVTETGKVPVDFKHANRADPRASHYQMAGERVDAAGTFMANLQKLSAESTPPKDITPGDTLLTVTLTGEEGPWAMTFREGSDTWSAVDSEHLRGTVWVSADDVATLLDDLSNLP